MRDAAKIKETIAKSDTTEAIVRTTGDGGLREVTGTTRTDSQDVSAALELLGAMLHATGLRLALGAFRDAVLTFDEGVLVLAREDVEAVLGVIATSEASAGLVLNQVRRVLGRQSAAVPRGAA